MLHNSNILSDRLDVALNLAKLLANSHSQTESASQDEGPRGEQSRTSRVQLSVSEE